MSTLSLTGRFTGGNSVYTFPVKDGVWSAVSLTYDKSSPTTAPQVRVNFVDVTETISHSSGTALAINTGYCVGNDSSQTKGWNGRIAHLQVFNRQLSAAEQDACLREPGSVTNGLRLWLPMTHGTDINDRSVNGSHGTATDLATGPSGPPIFTHPFGAPSGVVFLTPGILPVTQFVIPRHADGATHPGAQLRGMGTISAIQGMVYGPENGTDPQEIVVTEGWGTTMNKWDNNTPANAEAVLQPVVRDISILGKVDVAGYDDSSGLSDIVNSVNMHVYNQFFPFGDAIDFNGSSSKLERTTANVLNSSTRVTVCCWIRPDGVGENNGYVFTLDPDGPHPDSAAFIIRHDSSSNHLVINKKAGAAGTEGVWKIPITDGIWNAVCVRLDFSGDYAPTARVNLKSVPVTVITTPVGIQDLPVVGYCVGNRSAQDQTWDGRIAQLQVFNAILTDGEADATVITPGLVTSNRRLYLPMTSASDTNDASGLLLHGTGTDLGTGPNFKDREIGLAMQASGPLVDNVGFFHIPGTACIIQRGGGDLAGSIQPFDREFASLEDLSVYRAYRGISIEVVDTEVGNIEVEYLRDYGLRVLYGNAKFRGAVHVSGVKSGVAPAIYGTALWLPSTGGPSWGGPFYCENSDVGMRIDSSGNKITNFYSHSCNYRNLWFDYTSQRNSVSNFEIEVLDGISEINGGEAVLIAGQASTLSNGTIGGGLSAVPAGEIGVRITNGNRQTIRDVDFVGTFQSSAPLISVSCNAFAPFNNSIIISKCTNAGTFLDLHPLYASGKARAGADNDKIRLAGSQVFLDDELNGMTVKITSGTGSGQSRTIIDYVRSTNTATVSSSWTTNPADDSTYELRTNIGTGNYIWLTTAGNVTTKIKLPPEWDDTANEIWVDGDRKQSGD
jgi:hypothetical protein